MKLIYRAQDITEAQIISGMLASNGIESHVGGFYLQGGIGDLSAMDFATIYVADTDVKPAIAVISEYDHNFSKDNNPARKKYFTLPLIILLLSTLLILVMAILFGNPEA